jgi:hypothetical protein
VGAGTWAIIAVAPRKDRASIAVISFFIVFLLFSSVDDLSRL